MFLSSVGEASVIDHVCSAVLVHECRVVPLCNLDVGVVVAAPFHGCHETYAGFAKPVAADGCGGDCGVAIFVHIWTGDVFGTEFADLVAAGLLQCGIGDEQVPVIALFHDVGAFAGVAMAAGDFDAVVLVGLVFNGFVSGAVVAQTIGSVKFEHPQSAEPGSESHPQIAVVVILHAGVDGVDFSIAGGEVACGYFIGIEHLRYVGFADGVISESGVDHRTYERPVAFDVICGEQHNRRLVVDAVYRHVHAPFLHGFVVDHVGCPHIAGQIRVGWLLGPLFPKVSQNIFELSAEIIGERFPID